MTAALLQISRDDRQLRDHIHQLHLGLVISFDLSQDQPGYADMEVVRDPDCGIDGKEDLSPLDPPQAPLAEVYLRGKFDLFQVVLYTETSKFTLIEIGLNQPCSL